MSKRASLCLWLCGCVLIGCSDSEAIGTALQTLGGFEDNVLVAQTERPRNPSVAWIGSGSSELGKMLVTFHGGGTPQAGWTASDTNWASASPSWQPERYWDDATAPWPQPENWLDFYDPTEVTFQRYEWPRAIWSGLDDVAVIVATSVSIDSNDTFKDLVALASTDGGATFTSAQILSINFTSTLGSFQSGGHIRPDTVHVMQPRTADALGADRGGVSVPLYVVWYNDDPQARGWWMTKFVVSVDMNGDDPVNQPGRATMAQIANPRKLSPNPMPAGFGYAAIDGHVTYQGEEAVTLYWSERVGPLPQDCSSPNQTMKVSWKSAYTTDWGKTWTDFGDIDSDENWRPCIFGGDGRSGHNSDRPVPVTQQAADFGPNDYGPAAYYAAINKNVGGEQKVVLHRWRDWSSLAWDRVFQSTSPGDAWGQSTAMHVGKYQTQTLPVVSSVVQGLIWRWQRPGFTVRTMGSTQKTLADDWSSEDALSSPLAAMTYSDAGGAYTSVAFMQTCLYDVGGTCASSSVAWPAIPALAVWVQGGTAGTQIVVRKFEH